VIDDIELVIIILYDFYLDGYILINDWMIMIMKISFVN